MATFLLLVIVCLLLNRKLGLFVLCLPLIGIALFLVALAVNMPSNAVKPVVHETYEQCVRHWAKAVC